MVAQPNGTCADPHFVYRCFDADGRLLYVGLTKNPEQRLAGHRSQTLWFGDVVSYGVLDPAERALRAEHARKAHMQRMSLARWGKAS